MTVSTSQKLDWLDAVMADRSIDARSKVVAFCIMQHVNQGTGLAFVSDQTVVDKTGIPLTMVIRARKNLRSAGWITWKRTRTASVYSTLTGPMAAIAKRQLDLKLARQGRRRDMPPVTEQDMPRVTEHDVSPVEELETGVVSPVALLVVPPVAELVMPPVADIPLSLNPVVITPSKKSLATNPEFEVWWSRFPRKVEKLQALKIYGRIIESCQATPAELLAGAEQYAAEQRGQDPKYVKHPATWLSKGCWQDETAPASPHRNPETRSRADSALDGMRGYVEDPT